MNLRNSYPTHAHVHLATIVDHEKVSIFGFPFFGVFSVFLMTIFGAYL